MVMKIFHSTLIQLKLSELIFVENLEPEILFSFPYSSFHLKLPFKYMYVNRIQ